MIEIGSKVRYRAFAEGAAFFSRVPYDLLLTRNTDFHFHETSSPLGSRSWIRTNTRLVQSQGHYQLCYPGKKKAPGEPGAYTNSVYVELSLNPPVKVGWEVVRLDESVRWLSTFITLETLRRLRQ